MTNLSGTNLNNGAAVGPQGEGRESPSRFPKYQAYKNSGVEWLGDVPEHWKISPLKFSASCNDSVLPDSTDDDYEIEYVEISDVNEMSGITGSTSYKFADAPSRARRMLQNGDVLVSTVRTYLRAIAPVVAPPENLIASTGFAVVRPRKGILDGAFLGYLLRAEWWISEVIARSVGVSYPAINASDLIGLNVPVPAWHEQTQIARFLDHETARIDALIEEQQRLIELLKEKRQAVISHAVTKGLDPTVPMKDSCVEWLGEVPVHWGVVSLKRVVVFQRGHDLPSESREEGNVPVISSGGYSGTHSVACAKAPGIVTGRYGSIGQFTLAIEDYWPLNTALYSIELYGNKPRYVWYLLQAYAEHFLLNSLKSAVPGVDRNDVHVVKVVAAPVEEQDQIVIYIDRISNQLDQLVEAAEKNVTLLQERRSALISAAVTGKIDVRGWQPPASTQAAETAVAEAV